MPTLEGSFSRVISPLSRSYRGRNDKVKSTKPGVLLEDSNKTSRINLSFEKIIMKIIHAVYLSKTYNQYEAKAKEK